MQSEQQTRRRSRRAAPTPTVPEAEKPSVILHRKQRRRITNTLLLGVLLAVVVLMIIIFPKEPNRHAYYSIGGTNEGGAGTAYYSGLVISEVMASNRTAMPDTNGEFSDWVEIWNSSDHAIDLYNVGLSDDELSIKFLFPRMVLQPDEKMKEIIVQATKKKK